MARADDPTALRFNPAALARLAGTQLSVGSHLVFYDACFARTGGYDDSGVSTTATADSRFGFPDPGDPNNFASMQFPEVCRGGPPTPNPQMVMSLHPMEGLGIAFGILSPAAAGLSTWGNGDGSITVDGVELPSPVRYQAVEQNVALVWPSIGVGYSPIPELSFGATFMWGISLIDVALMVNAGAGSQDPGVDALARLEATDSFIPGGVFSVHYTPFDALDIAAMVRVSDAIDGEGDVSVTTGAFGTSMPGSYSPFTSNLSGASLRAPQPWELGLSFRYADRIRPRSRNPEQLSAQTGQIDDPMLNERFDLELDLIYTVNSGVTDFVIRPPSESVGICEGDRDCVADGTGGLNVGLPAAIPITKGWSDQLSVRVGGDFNVVPGMLALRGGAHFETSGMSTHYQTPDFMPGMRLGLHVGATLRVDRFDISVAYGHIFQFDHTVDDPRSRHVAPLAGRGTEDTYTCRNDNGEIDETYDPERPIVQRGCYPPGFGSLVNGGTFSAAYNVMSLNVRYHFE